MEDLVREVAGRSDVNVAVSVVGAHRKERQVGSRPAGPGPEVLAWVDDLARAEVPDGGRLRVRAWQRGGKPVRGVVVVVSPSGSSPQPVAPAHPQTPTVQPAARPAPSRCPSCQRAGARMLTLERRATELDSTLGQERTQVIALQGDNELLRGQVAHWRDEAMRHRDRARRLEARLATQHEQVQELLAAVDLLERAAG